MSQLEALQRLLQEPLDGPSQTLGEYCKEERISLRQGQLLIELGELAAYKNGRKWIVPHAAKVDLRRRRIQARIAELEALAE